MRKHKLDKNFPRLRSTLAQMLSVALLAVTAAGVSAGQETSSPHVLTLDDEIRLGVANNRSLKIASLEVDKSKWQVAEAKTKRLSEKFAA